MKKIVPIFIALAWFSIGVMLLMRGLRLAVYFPNEWLANFLGSWEKSSLASITTGLLIGLFKGRMVFRKAVTKLLEKFEKGPIVKIMARQLMIIPLMMGLGILCSWIFSKTFMSVLDTAVGTALIYGGWTIILSMAFSYRTHGSVSSHESK